MPPIVAVAVDAPLRRLFDYRPPAGSTDGALVPGTRLWVPFGRRRAVGVVIERREHSDVPAAKLRTAIAKIDRKSTRLNSSHGYISYAVFCLKKKKILLLH